MNSDAIPTWVRERVYRYFGFSAERFAIVDHAGHYAILANPQFDKPYVVIDLDNGDTLGMYREPAEATARLAQLAGGEDR